MPKVKSNGFAQLLVSLLKLLQWHRAIGAYMIVENGGCLVELIKTHIWTQLGRLIAWYELTSQMTTFKLFLFFHFVL